MPFEMRNVNELSYKVPSHPFLLNMCMFSTHNELMFLSPKTIRVKKLNIFPIRAIPFIGVRGIVVTPL
jgi:hypothetical protein